MAKEVTYIVEDADVQDVFVVLVDFLYNEMNAFDVNFNISEGIIKATLGSRFKYNIDGGAANFLVSQKGKNVAIFAYYNLDWTVRYKKIERELDDYMELYLEDMDEGTRLEMMRSWRSEGKRRWEKRTTKNKVFGWILILVGVLLLIVVEKVDYGSEEHLGLVACVFSLVPICYGVTLLRRSNYLNKTHCSSCKNSLSGAKYSYRYIERKEQYDSDKKLVGYNYYYMVKVTCPHCQHKMEYQYVAEKKKDRESANYEIDCILSEMYDGDEMINLENTTD